jgi:hypothetical protein
LTDYLDVGGFRPTIVAALLLSVLSALPHAITEGLVERHRVAA